MANVCKEFRNAAEDVFRRQHTEIVIYTHFNDKNLSESLQPMFYRMLCKFGQLITSLDTNGGENLNIESIDEFCPNLKRLRLCHSEVNFNFPRPMFARLKCLDIDYCGFIGGANHPSGSFAELEHLVVSGENIESFLLDRF